MASFFKIQKPLPDKHGAMKKKGRTLGGWVVRYFKVGWDGEHAVLYYGNSANAAANKKISLDKCMAKKNTSHDDPAASLFGLDLEFRDSGVLQGTKSLYATSALERDEWVELIRKYAVNSSIDNSYAFTRNANSKLGEGSFATVYKAVDRVTGKEWALKEMLKKSIKADELENLKNEVRISIMVGSHANIVYVKEFVENVDKYYIVLEYLTGGELFDRIVESPGGHFTEKNAATLMRQLMGALAYMHSKNVAHRDLKPENFLLATNAPDSQVKIADFGFATIVDGPNSLRGLCGSPGYVAPEVVASKEGYGLPVDVWSMGVILYILLTGIPPFAAENDEDSFILTIRGFYDKSALEETSAEARDLVAKMLTYRATKRITADQTLEHPWLSGGAADKALRSKDNLRSWRARMRLKKAIIATMTTVKMHAIMRKVAERHATPDANVDHGS